MAHEPQVDWKTFKLILIVGPVGYAIFAFLSGSLTTAIPLALFSGLMAALLFFRRGRRRDVTLHVAIAVLLAYQVSLLRTTVDEPNIGIVWFLVVPALVASLGNRLHIIVWTPLTIAAIWYCWRLYAHYPSLGHELSLSNLIAATVVISAAALGVITQRARRERKLTDALEAAKRESAEREIARRDADAAQSAMTTFLGSMSHELRTPLTSIVLSTDALDGQLDEQAHKIWTSNIRESAQSLVLLLNDVLDLARSDAGAPTLNVQSFDSEELLESVRSIVQPMAASRGVFLFVGAAPDVPVQWRGDAIRIRQVLVNLLHNALRHAAASRVWLDARFADGTLTFEVGDDGRGIEPDVQRDIFKPFHRLSDDSEDDGQGYGLGLTIANNYVKAMGSDLTLRSSPGQGASFSFSLDASVVDTESFLDRYPGLPEWAPTVSLDLACEHSRAWADQWCRAWSLQVCADGPELFFSDIGPDAGRRLGSVRDLTDALTVLASGGARSQAGVDDVAARAAVKGGVCVICDDDPKILKILSETLELSGFKTASFERGDEMLFHIANHPIGMVLLDVNLGRESGVDILKTIRALPGDASLIPVCMLSGGLNQRDACTDAGADEYLLKPSSARELADTCAHLIELGQARLMRELG